MKYHSTTCNAARFSKPKGYAFTRTEGVVWNNMPHLGRVDKEVSASTLMVETDVLSKAPVLVPEVQSKGLGGVLISRS